MGLNFFFSILEVGFLSYTDRKNFSSVYSFLDLFLTGLIIKNGRHCLKKASEKQGSIFHSDIYKFTLFKIFALWLDY